MKFSIDREVILAPLQAVQGVVERRQSLPILANLLLSASDDRLAITATDMEVELVATAELEAFEPGEITVPARKLIDICRSLPEGARLEFEVEEGRALLRSGRSRFVLSTLPAAEFPSTEELSDAIEVDFEQRELQRLLALTQFAMAHQDVRYYLNGLLLEFGAGYLRAVATDGHRLAVCELERDGGSLEERQVIVPRKAVLEMLRLMRGEGRCRLGVGQSAVRLAFDGTRLTSKLIDGRFPEYERVIPDPERCDKHLRVSTEALRQVLARAAILSNDKYRAVRLCLEPDLLRVLASNPEQEEAEDVLEVSYEGERLEIGFNVTYLMEALATLPADEADLYLTDAGSSCLMLPKDVSGCRFVVMPMRL